MDVDTDVISIYTSVINDLEQIHASYEGATPERYSKFQQQLNNCRNQLDGIIAVETDHASFMALYQQKHQLTMLIGIIERMLQKKRPNLTFPPKQNENGNSDVAAATAEVPKVDGLSKVVGLHDVKKVLKSLVILPKTQPQLFYNRPVCNSILLYGPPGTGKTRLAHALAAEANAEFHCLSSGDILSHYVGQTEKSIKALFQSLARNCGFTMLFIDEIDAFCRKRSDNEQEYTRRIKTELMCQLSNIQDCTNVIIMAATNCPWDLDPAILRRFHKRIYIPLPDHFERLQFFRFLSNGNLFEDAPNDWTLLLQKTAGYSCSDLHDVVQTANEIPLNELEDTKIWKCCPDGFYEPVLKEQDFAHVICSDLRDLPARSVRARNVHMNDLLTAVDGVKCTVTASDIERFERFNRN